MLFLTVFSETLVMPDELEFAQVDEMDTNVGMSGSGMEWDGESNRVEPGHSV